MHTKKDSVQEGEIKGLCTLYSLFSCDIVFRLLVPLNVTLTIDRQIIQFEFSPT